MNEEKTLFEELKEKVAHMVYEELDKMVSNTDDIRVVKCMKPYPNHPDISDIEEATKVEITKYPEDGYVMIKATFENPTKHSNMAMVYYKDRVLTRKYYDTEFTNNTDKHLQLLFDIGCDHD